MKLANRVIPWTVRVFMAIIHYSRSRDPSMNIHNNYKALALYPQEWPCYLLLTLNASNSYVTS